MKICVTGSSGLVGSAVVEHFARTGNTVVGVDNNQRQAFFGPEGDTTPTRVRLERTFPQFRPVDLDIRDRAGVSALIQAECFDAVVHAAGQPSHDFGGSFPVLDFEVNTVGTLNLLEAVRLHTPQAAFVHLSTNKVYGDNPNKLALREEPTRWDFVDAAFTNGIPESLSIDQCTHSLFGASKTAADILVQEYGRYFGLKTCCLRCGCLTGASHAGVELHGFLSYLTRCAVSARPYTIFGDGKQVRDNLHADDVATFVAAYVGSPRAGEVYNLGGGKANACSVIEAIRKTEALLGRPMTIAYDRMRLADHVCYYSDLRKTKSHYPAWRVARSLDDILVELVGNWQSLVSRA